MSSPHCPAVGYARPGKGPTQTRFKLNCRFVANGLYVHQNEVPFIKNPSFHLQALTRTFFLEEAAGKSVVEFDVTGKNLGEIIHVSGAEARDYGQEVAQKLSSLHLRCEWGLKGLEVSAEGRVAARSELLGEIGSDLFNASYYEILLAISWQSLKTLFEMEPAFVERMITRFAR